MIQRETNELLQLLREIKLTLEKQTELLEAVLTNSTTNPQTKITVVGNKVVSNAKGLNNTDNFTL